MTEKAVIDRFEGNTAILTVVATRKRLEVQRSQLPMDSREGDWFLVELIDGNLQKVEPDAGETERVRQRITEKLAALRRGDHLK